MKARDVPRYSPATIGDSRPNGPDQPTWDEVLACCRVSYGHPAARWLLGDSLHPGGLALTGRLARLMKLAPGHRVLDAGSGLGTSAIYVAETFGSHATGVTLEGAGVSSGYTLAEERGVTGMVSFATEDILEYEPTQGTFDAVLMECVLSVFPDKAAVLHRLNSMLSDGGRLGLSDVTVAGPLPDELAGVLGRVGCVGGALSLEGYVGVLERAGFVVEHVEDCDGEASEFLARVADRLGAAELAVGLGKLPLRGLPFGEARRLLHLAQDLVSDGVLGYGLLVGRKL